MRHPAYGFLLLLFLCLPLSACGGEKPEKPSPQLPPVSFGQVVQGLDRAEAGTCVQPFTGVVREVCVGFCWMGPADGGAYLVKVPLTFPAWRALKPGQRLRVVGTIASVQARAVEWYGRTMILPCLSFKPGCALEPIGAAP